MSHQRRFVIKRKRQLIHPGGILRRHYLEPMHLIINERGAVTPDMTLRLSKALNASAELWLNLQTNYDLWNAASMSKEWEKVKALVSA